MNDTLENSWLNELEVTKPIQDIMEFVEELAQNYERRTAAVHIEYQKDVEEILSCYKNEKKEFDIQLQKQQKTIMELQADLLNVQEAYKTIKAEYKAVQQELKTTKRELTSVTKAFKNTNELMTLAKERIVNANKQISAQLTTNKHKKNHFKAVYEFLQKGIGDRTNRSSTVNEKQEPQIIGNLHDLDNMTAPIIARAKQDPEISDSISDQDALM